MENAEPSDSRIPGGSGRANDDTSPTDPDPAESCIAGHSGSGRGGNNELKIKGKIDEFNTEPIAFDVGGRPFFTTAGTLCTRNSFFPTFISGKCKIPLAQNGALFVDSDPDVFNHIWQFLRHGAFPIAFQPDGITHDHKMYQDNPLLLHARARGVARKQVLLPGRDTDNGETPRATGRGAGLKDPDITKAEFLPCKVETEPVWHCLDWETHPAHSGCWVGESRSPESPPEKGRYGSIVRTSYLEVRRVVEYSVGWSSCYGNHWTKFYDDGCKWDDDSGAWYDEVSGSGSSRRIFSILG